MSLTFYHGIDLLSTCDYYVEKYFFNHMIAIFTVAIHGIIYKKNSEII